MRALSRSERLLGERLESLYRRYGPETRDTDPIVFPHRYAADEDREVAGWIATAFAYGQVRTIQQNVGRLLAALGPSPASAIDRITDHRRFAREELAGFRHRFHGATDAAALFYAIGRVRAEAGSACKRWNLYLRWMVRKDALDFGLWPGIPTDRLVIPTDTHVHRIARRLGLTRRRTADWKAAREITTSLLRFDARDPVRFDYALCRIGILDICHPATRLCRCNECPMQEPCSVGRKRVA